MACNGHRDVNLPRATWHRAGGFLADFAEWLRALGFNTWTVEKEHGNHLTDYWLYATMDSAAPAKSQVQFGCTAFAKVNPAVHSYARGKGKHLTAAVELLQNFTDQVWAFDEEQAPRADEPSTPPQDDDWEVLDLRKYYIPNTENVFWFSDADASVWFIPDSTGARSRCGEWRAYSDARVGIWWVNEIDRQLYFPAAA